MLTAAWGWPQWLVIFFYGLRAVLSLGVKLGILPKYEPPKNQHALVGHYIAERIVDGVAIAVLFWGGFWG